jgi:hypothetical protein
MIKHKHHIIPRHRGGSDDPSNLVEVTLNQHIMFHWCEWNRTGNHMDQIAYRMLSGKDDSKEQARLNAIQVRKGTALRSEQARQASLRRWKNDEERKRQSERTSKTWIERRKKRRFTPEDVAVIRSEVYTIDELADMFSAPRNTIKTVRQGVTYGDLPMGNVKLRKYNKHK